MRDRRVQLLVAAVVALFLAGGVWRAFNPDAGETTNEELELVSRQDGYYLCLHKPPLSVGAMYKLVRRELPQADQSAALEGCRQAQRR